MRKLSPLTLLSLPLLLTAACDSPVQPGAEPLAVEDASFARGGGGPPRVDVCHRTGSETNPWVLLTVSAAAQETHVTRHGDLLPGDRIDDEFVLGASCDVVHQPADGDLCLGGIDCSYSGGGELPDDPPGLPGPGF